MSILNKNNQLTIGADPELVLVSPISKNYIAAQTVFRPNGTEFGLDGNPTTVELRPKYSTSPLELVENIFQILDKAKDEYPQVFRLNMRSSDNRVMAGGHLHFGHPKLLADAKVYQKTGMSLDYLLSPLVALVEVPDNRRARLNSSYGKLGDLRDAPWGMEYRTPASWLASRKLAEGVTCLGYAIAKEAIENDNWKPDIFNFLKWEEFRQIYNANMTGVIKLVLPNIIKEIEKLSETSKYKAEIGYLIRSARQGKPLLETEIKEGWAINFITLANMKLENLEDLIKRLAEALTVPGDESTSTPEWVRPGNDFRVADIAGNVSWAIQSIVGQKILELLPNPQIIKIRGLKKEKGNIIYIELTNETFQLTKQEQLTKLIVALCKSMDYPEPEISFKVDGANQIYLPREMRELDNYLSEAITTVMWLFLNRESYKSKTQTKAGRNIALPFGIHNAIEPLFETIKDKKRPTVPTAADFVDDGGEIQTEKFIEYIRTYLCPRIVEAQEHEVRLRLPYNLRQIAQNALDRFNFKADDNCPLCKYMNSTDARRHLMVIPPISADMCGGHLLDRLLNYSFSEDRNRTAQVVSGQNSSARIYEPLRNIR